MLVSNAEFLPDGWLAGKRQCYNTRTYVCRLGHFSLELGQGHVFLGGSARLLVELHGFVLELLVVRPLRFPLLDRLSDRSNARACLCRGLEYPFLDDADFFEKFRL